MKYFVKRLTGVLGAAILGLSMVSSSISITAQEMNSDTIQDGNTNLPIEALGASAFDISQAYPEVEQKEDTKEKCVPNNMDRIYTGEDLTVSTAMDAYSSTESQENTDPNNAYLVEHGNVVQGELTKTSEMRWYGFILDKSSKVSIELQTVPEVDGDVYLFELNQDTYELNVIGGSATSGYGINEYCSQILDPGIYYFAVSAYEGNGQFAFAFYATQDMSNEVNDTLSNAAAVSVNSTITGVIDNPYDQDYYTFTLTSPVLMSMTATTGEYEFGFLKVDGSGKIYKISKKEDMYQFDAGTYYFVVRSTDGTYDANSSYSIKLNKIVNIADDPNSFYYMVNEKAKIVFQSDANGGRMYVNGNPIDISYNYKVDASTSAGTQKYDITMSNAPDLRAKIYQNQFMFDDAEQTIYYGMTMPDAVNYIYGSKGVGPTGNALELSLYSTENFYKIHCRCTGAYASNNLYKDLNFVTVFINPDTGKLVDIEHINYFYEYASGSNSMSFTRPHSRDTKYYYPYYNGSEPTIW